MFDYLGNHFMLLGSEIRAIIPLKDPRIIKPKLKNKISYKLSVV